MQNNSNLQNYLQYLCYNILFADSFLTSLSAICSILLHFRIFLTSKDFQLFVNYCKFVNFLHKNFYTTEWYQNMVSNLFIGDTGQLQPFTVTARKMRLMSSIFDLAISRPMKHFTIHGQYRSNDTYQAFLGNFLYVLLHYIV